MIVTRQRPGPVDIDPRHLLFLDVFLHLRHRSIGANRKDLQIILLFVILIKFLQLRDLLFTMPAIRIPEEQYCNEVIDAVKGNELIAGIHHDHVGCLFAKQ